MGWGKKNFSHFEYPLYEFGWGREMVDQVLALSINTYGGIEMLVP